MYLLLNSLLLDLSSPIIPAGIDDLHHFHHYHSSIMVVIQVDLDQQDLKTNYPIP